MCIDSRTTKDHFFILKNQVTAMGLEPTTI